MQGGIFPQGAVPHQAVGHGAVVERDGPAHQPGRPGLPGPAVDGGEDEIALAQQGGSTAKVRQGGTDLVSYLTLAPPRVGEVTHYVADIAKARALLGYEPRVPLKEGIARAVAWATDYWSKTGTTDYTDYTDSTRGESV